MKKVIAITAFLALAASFSAVAVSFARGPHAGLKILDELDPVEAMQRYQPYHAARADLLRRERKRGHS